MSYKVIHYFTDLQDFSHPYKVGDIFPRQGMKVSEERLKELSSSNNKQGKPLIALEKSEEVKKGSDIKVEKLDKDFEYTKTDINRMPIAELKKLAKNEKLKDTEDMSGAELKKLLIEHFKL